LDLPSVVKEVLSTVLPGETAVKLTGLPAAAVLGSKYELMRVVQNLIKNALESGAKRINVDVSRHEERIRLAVEDDGPGMSPEDIRKALGGGYTTKVNGTGLGLNICRQIVTTHGGRMEMGARPEKGLEVAIFFPALGL
jgi:signal transduction histidine kinase